MHKAVHFIAAAALLAAADGASAACAIATVTGTWGFSYDAVDLAGARNCVGVGLMTFNSGTGSSNTVKITAQRNSCGGDPVASFAASGTYTVASTCIGKSTNLKYSGTSKVSTLDFNIVQAGTRLQFVLVQGNGLTLHGEAFKR